MAIVYPIDDVVDVILSVGDRVATARDFGTPLLIGGHNLNTDVYREYSSISALASDGFISGNPIYEMAKNIFAGNAAPKKLLLGRRTIAGYQVQLPTASVILGETYGVRVVATNVSTGVRYDKTFSIVAAVSASDTTQEICTILASQIEADTDISSLVAATATSYSGGYIVGVAPTGSTPLQVAPVHTSQRVFVSSYTDVLSTVYSDIKGQLPSGFFFILLDARDTTSASQMAAIAEADQRMFITSPNDNTVFGSGTADIASTFKGLGYNNTVLFATNMGAGEAYNYYDASLVGSWATVPPGSDTLKGKTLVGSAPANLSPTEVSYAKSKNANVYIQRGGTGFLEEGVTSSGRFADITRGMLWLEAKLEEDIFNLIKLKTDTGTKIPYTNTGIQMVASVMETRLKEAVRVGFLDTYKIFPPLVENISTNDRANRLLPDLPFEARLAGAFHFLTIRGYITV